VVTATYAATVRAQVAILATLRTQIKASCLAVLRRLCRLLSALLSSRHGLAEL
jgi:hypothetical protein